MRAPILVLPPELASQIAAGEVVERPASAVKELVENALDAGAQRVDVSITGGGISSLRVSDDGHGMSREEALRALERHATSKLTRLTDLDHLHTFGFRGEALPTVASVGRLSLVTRTAEQDVGTRITVDAGGPPQVQDTGAPVGTTVEVRELFFNVPARRKFLKSMNTESGHVLDVLEGAALARPDVTFSLERDGRRVREWLRAPDREARVRALLGDEALLPCQGERGPLRVLALLSRPEHARQGAAGLRLLVNGRPIRDRALAASVAQSFGGSLERGRYPRGVVYLDLPTQLVDVNVHPQKAEVRFADARATSDAVYAILGRALADALHQPLPTRSAWASAHTPAPRPAPAAGRSCVPEAPRAPVEFIPLTPSPHEGEEREADAPRAASSVAEPAPAPRAAYPTPEASPPLDAREVAAPLRPSAGTTWSALRFVAQVRQTYLICEGPEGLYVLDQHSAAERVAFDRLRKQYQARTVASQSLLFPLVLEVSAEEARLCEARAEDFAAVGIDVRLRGEGALSVHTVPRLLQRASPERLVRDLLGELGRAGARGFSEAVDTALAAMACHGAVRAGDPLTRSEVEALLQALDQADFAAACPHGRPVVALTTWGELERKVGRR